MFRTQLDNNSYNNNLLPTSLYAKRDFIFLPILFTTK